MSTPVFVLLLAEADLLHRLVAYFVVFFKSGFSPSDLRIAQAAGCELRCVMMACLHLTSGQYISQNLAPISSTDVER